MKVSIRRNVFETNSSTEHTFTFSVQDAATADFKGKVPFAMFDKKAAIIQWLYGECYGRADNFFIGGLMFYPDMAASPSKFSKEFRDKLFEMTGTDENTEPDMVVDEICNLITIDENEYFADPDFNYASKVNMIDWEHVESNLSGKECRTLALKIALFVLFEFDGLADYEKMFFDVLQNKFNGESFIEIEGGFLADQTVIIGELYNIFHDIVLKLGGVPIDKIMERVGYVGIDGLLNDYYDFSVFSDELGIDTSNYKHYADTLTKLLTDDTRIIFAE